MPSESVPVGQSTQDEAPGVAEYVPVEQDLHAVMPSKLAYWPGHAVIPSRLAYWPGAQSKQAPQLVHSEAPAAEYLPALHLEQVSTVVAPKAAENLPALHLEQVSTVVEPTAAENLPV